MHIKNLEKQEQKLKEEGKTSYRLRFWLNILKSYAAIGEKICCAY